MPSELLQQIRIEKDIDIHERQIKKLKTQIRNLKRKLYNLYKPKRRDYKCGTTMNLKVSEN